jgi:uncharacterized protein YgiM (DUF1202 family)
MKAIMMDEEIPVYSSIDDTSISIRTLHKGEEVELGKVTQKKRKTWVEVNLPGDQKGYISGDTKIFAIRKATVMNAAVDVKESANDDARVIKTLVKGSTVTVTGVEKPEGGTDWFKVHDEANIEGYVPTSTKLRVVPELSQSNAVRNLVTGTIFAAIGVFFTLSNNSTGTTNNMVWISYAVIFFGLLQFVQGGYEYIQIIRARKAKQ